MKVTVLKGPAPLPMGTRIKPSAEQLRRREAILEKDKGGWFVATAAIEFKQGEVVEISAKDMNKLPRPFGGLVEPFNAKAKDSAPEKADGSADTAVIDDDDAGGGGEGAEANAADGAIEDAS